MERFFGFDLGDAESAVSRLDKKDQAVPQMLTVCGAQSFITAYAQLENGLLQIGEKACYNADAVMRKLRFKSRFLSDPSVSADIRRFAAGVLGELYGSGDLVKNEDCCFYIGCPAGWNKNAREQYREIFQNTGYPPARIISESRAALISACQSKHLQLGCDILSKPVLVIDIGSSTTDFAYICRGREVEMQTAGEVTLGGGMMDELLLEKAVSSSRDSARLQAVFEESEPWRSYCEFAARRLKEKYYSDEDYWDEHPCTETILVRYKKTLRLTVTMDRDIADTLVNKKNSRLGGRSFKEVFLESLDNVRSNITGDVPELLFLTGGVSKLPEIRKWCEERFPDAVIISGAEPEFSVSRGLAWSARIDDELSDFRAELEELKASHTVEDIVTKHIDKLYRDMVDTLITPVMENVAAPIFTRWRDGGIKRIADVDEVMEHDLEAWLRSDEAKKLMSVPVGAWLREVADDLEEYTVPICIRHHVPYSALSLSSFLSSDDIGIHLDSKDVFAVDKMTTLIESVISLIAGFLCGGSGVALIASGPAGILAGMIISLLVLSLGRSKMESTIYSMNVPRAMRRVIPRAAFNNRLDELTSSTKSSLYDRLENEKNEEITSRMVDDISGQIEQCLTKMAEVVEIPLG